MKVRKEFSPTTIVIESEDELKTIISAFRYEHDRHRNGWCLGDKNVRAADMLQYLIKNLENTR